MRRWSVVLVCAAACAAEPSGDDEDAGDDDERPRLIAATPAHGAVDVYPAQVFDGTSQRVRVTLGFDEPMDTSFASIRWRPVGGGETAITGTWMADARTLVADIVAPPLTGQRPLEDRTTYELVLADLRDQAWNRVDPGAGLEAGVLRFTTGVYDPLLNHSCGHVRFGPFVEVEAAAAPGPTIPRTDSAHTRYTVRLAGPPYRGFTRARTLAAATWHLFLDGEVPVRVTTLGGESRPVVVRATPAACDGITHELTFATAGDEQLDLELGTAPAAEVRFIVEVVADD